jgi:hypothetical protein
VSSVDSCRANQTLRILRRRLGSEILTTCPVVSGLRNDAGVRGSVLAAQ